MQSEQLYYSGRLYTLQGMVDGAGNHLSFDGTSTAPPVWTDVGPVLEGSKYGYIDFVLTLEATEGQIASVTHKMAQDETVYEITYTSEYLDELMSKEVENNRSALENYLASEEANDSGKAALESKIRQARATTIQAGTWTVTVNNTSGIVSEYCLQLEVESQDEHYLLTGDVTILDYDIPHFDFPRP